LRGLSNNFGKYSKELISKINKFRPEFWLIIIVIVALIIRLNFFLGMGLNDDLCYLDSAHQITEGEFIFHEWIVFPRIMMHYPIALFFSLFGVSGFSASLYILLCSLGSVIVAYYIGKTIFGTWTGLASAFLMSIFPIEVVHATTIVPDVPVAFFMGLSVCLFLIGEKKDKNIYYIFAGIAIGLAWLVKSISILIILFYLSYFLLDKIFDFKYLLVGVKKKSADKLKQIFKIRLGFILTSLGFLVVLLLEGWYYLLVANNFFFRFNVETQHYVSTLLGRTDYLNIYPEMLLVKSAPNLNFFGLFFIIFCACVFVFLLFDRNKKIIIPIAWFAVLYLWMQYGTMNINEFVLIDHLRRFGTVWAIPIAVTIGYFIAGSKISKKRIFNIANIIVISVLLTTSFYYVNECHELKEQALINYRETADFLKQHPDKDIYVDYISWGKLRFLLGYEGAAKNLKFLERVENPDQIKDAFVVVNGSRGSFEVEVFVEKLPEFIWDPPDNWIKVKVIITSYNVFHETIIYYVPESP
jgi:hypothetical protein